MDARRCCSACAWGVPPELALGFPCGGTRFCVISCGTLAYRRSRLYRRRMVLPPGYLLTWHTYGTWFHGDPAGSVDLKHNAFGTPRLGPDAARLERELASLRHPPVVLSKAARLVASKAMRDHCEIRGWDLRALAVRTNHVHAVIAAPKIAPEEIVRQLKSWATRRLRAMRLAGLRDRVWADHASTVYLFEPGAVDAKITYVREMQDVPAEGHGRPAWSTTYFRSA